MKALDVLVSDKKLPFENRCFDPVTYLLYNKQLTWPI